MAGLQTVTLSRAAPPAAPPDRWANGIRFQAQTAVRDGDRVLIASGGQSRNRDMWSGLPLRLLPGGMRLEAWQQNGSDGLGTMLWMHNLFIPLGLFNMFHQEARLWGDTIKFHRKRIPLATENFIGDAIGEFDTAVIAELWEEKWLNAFSIHVMLTPEDEAAIVETESEIIVPSSEVLEASVVTIPGDRDAVRQRMEGLGVAPRIAQALLFTYEQPVRETISVSSATRPSQSTEVVMADAIEETEGAEEFVEEESALAEMVLEEGSADLPAYEVDPAELAEALLADDSFIQVITSNDRLMDAIAQRVAARITTPLPAQAAQAAPVRIVIAKGNQEATQQPAATPKVVRQQAQKPPAAPPAKKVPAGRRDPNAALSIVRPTR